MKTQQNTDSKTTLNKLMLALGLMACTTLGVYAACYITVEPNCTVNGALATTGTPDGEADDGCPDAWYWLATTYHKRCHQLSSTQSPYLSWPRDGKTECTDYPNATPYIGNWKHEIWKKLPNGLCYIKQVIQQEATTWNCDDATLGGENCSGYYP